MLSVSQALLVVGIGAGADATAAVELPIMDAETIAAIINLRRSITLFLRFGSAYSDSDRTVD